MASDHHDDQYRAPIPIARAWHVLLSGGRAEVITAHHCLIQCGGVLSFRNSSPEHGSVLIRALSPRQWDEVILIDTPYAAAMHLSVPTSADAS